jgi:hypothetical protein
MGGLNETNPETLSPVNPSGTSGKPAMSFCHFSSSPGPRAS